ncbi:response regulator [Aureibaculum sp. 2210JD6-5]|uniref:LytR/AlgR family response regulator transcription factor n=1 Tax=Aureibaculum sp. 2210JD6-5 TaxID=3103957 RepID=UPI002AAD6E88|nr:response regulator [Aureibaculum sp. 2210JD6-5]MDY7395094.1 response regulator [Aureibaculum sp. 2210JD6-5]
MPVPIKIFIVEDEMIIGANISLQLQKLGYEVTGLVPKGEEALEHIKNNLPDIILMDIQLKGKLTGIETAKIIQANYNIPIIYLTANTDDFYFNEAKTTKPAAFISKPFKNLDLQRAIELTANELILEKETKKTTTPYVLDNCIFVKDHEKMVKIAIKKIYYIEADRNYCRIFSKDKAFLIVSTLKDINEKLPEAHFLRVHRSYIVNLSKIDEVGGTHLIVSKKVIPFSKTFREALLNRLQTI